MQELKHFGVVSSHKKQAAECTHGRVNLELLRPREVASGFGFANVKIHGDKWTDAELVIGDRIFDRLRRQLGHTSFPMLDNGNCMPFLDGYHTMFVKIDGEFDAVTYDVVVVDPETLTGPFAFVAYQMACQSGGDPKMSLPFVHKVEKLIVRSTHAFSRAVLEYDRNIISFNEEKGAAAEKLPFTYRIDFSPPLNFSRIDRCYLHMSPTNYEAEVHVVATYRHSMKNEDGCMRIEF